MKIKQLIIAVFFFTHLNPSKCFSLPTDTVEIVYQKGLSTVNHCTPWDHMKCVLITGGEVFEDGRDGKKVRHWWRMSYIGRACSKRYGTTFGRIFEGMWVVPHYTGVAIGSSFGYITYAIRGPRNPEKVDARKLKRKLRKEKRKNKTTSPLR